MKKVLITGGTKGIGLETAKKFVANNFEVIVCSSSAKNVDENNKLFPEINFFQCDMSDKKSVNDFADTILEKFGSIDILINNVGKFIQGRISDEADGIFEELMFTNLFGTYYLTRKILPKMIEKKEGTIFNIGSTASIKAYPDSGSYCISKHALIGLSKALREEMKEHNIKVISILPGATLTASWDGVELPENRLMPAQDIAQSIFDIYNLSPITVVEEIILRPMLGDL
ncbi:MAG: SDR family oxidoreductase [Candidatus Sericytochromatia bacterium]|nr:SDR family oxidoreductase [Candidatus Sericytochromatia bacterium]